jgi:hypothetical protein
MKTNNAKEFVVLISISSVIQASCTLEKVVIGSVVLSAPHRELLVLHGHFRPVGDHPTNASAVIADDAQTGEFGNMMTKGIIEPSKVVRIAPQDAPRLRAS